MDGLRLLSEIKQRCPDVPVLMATAYGDDERRSHARGLGAFDFIAKPVDFNHLKTQLQRSSAPAHGKPSAHFECRDMVDAHREAEFGTVYGPTSWSAGSRRLCERKPSDSGAGLVAHNI